MNSLNKEQKQQIFDYSVGIANQENKPEIERLISENPQASELHSRLKKQLGLLDEWQVEDCPDELVENTLAKLEQQTHGSSFKLEELLEKEQSKESKGKTVKVGFWSNFGETVTAAAVIIFAAAVFIAPLKYARHLYWKNVCKSQLSAISRGLDNYRNDYNGQMPSVVVAGGQPWWKIGYQGEENYSNTRNAWLLAKHGYTEPENFVCPAARDGQEINFDAEKAKDYYDFPGRKYITYSFRIRCDKGNLGSSGTRRVLIADVNPIFDNISPTSSDSFRIKLTKKLRNANSPNHNQTGQNVLFCDGSVEFAEKRHVGLSYDDIFTLQNIDVYEGNEVPSDISDAFLAP